jgi:hypothetical protein
MRDKKRARLVAQILDVHLLTSENREKGGRETRDAVSAECRGFWTGLLGPGAFVFAVYAIQKRIAEADHGLLSGGRARHTAQRLQRGDRGQHGERVIADEPAA